jgi:NADPH:quinone reductase-like Zn-dependent oxidoreductase
MRTMMKRVVVDRYGGPEVLRVVEEEDPSPGVGEVRVRVLAAGVSFTDALLRAGTYLGVPKPPFTPGYELVGVVEELGPGCSRLRVGDRIGALTVWGADAERVCLPEANAVEVPEDLDPAEVVSLVFTYMTAYQLLHRTAKVKHGETVLVHGAAGRVGTAVLELGAVAGLRLYGTCSARDRAAVERLGAVAIDYHNEDFVARVRELPGKGVDVVLDGLGGAMSLRSFRALRPGGRLVVFGHYSTLAHGRKSWRGWIEWYAATASVALWSLLSPRRRVLAYRIQKLREGRQVLPVSGSRRALPVGGGPRNPDWFREDFLVLLELLRRGEIHPIVAERLPLTEARRAHELLEQSASVGKLVLVP